ncbi:hypothetical protein HaLaN_13531, partial [Haematococcus lacustris]
TGQDQEGPAKEVAGAEEVPAAALTGLPTTRGASQQGDLMEAVLADAAPASAPDQACCSGQSTTGNSQGQGGESELSSGLDFRQQPAAGAPWTPDIDATLAAAAQAGGGDAPTGRPTPCMAAGQAVPGAVQAMAPPLAAQGLPLAGLPGLPSTGGMLGKRGARYQGNHGALLPCQASAEEGTPQLQALVSSRVVAGLTRCMVWLLQGMGNGPASAITTPQAGQAVPPGRQVATRSGPMNCAQMPVQQPLGTACPLSSPGLLAAPLQMPDCVQVVLTKAQQLQDLILVSRGAANDLAMQHNVDATLMRDLDLAFLPFLSQPPRTPNWNIRRDGQLVVLVCVPSNGLPTLQRPPPPFLVSSLGNSMWELVWKAPDWPWGSVQQHWGKVEWVAKGPHQELVLGLQAAVSLGHVADNNSTPSSSRLHAAASPTPTPQQQEPGSEGATMVEQMEAAATEGPSSLSLPHAPACGSEAPPGQHAGNGVEGAAGRSLTASLIGPVPGVAALLAVPGTPGIGSPASPHSQPATPASCLYPCMAFDGGPTGNLEPTGRQQDSAQASDATDPGCPLSDVGHTSVPKPMPNSMSERVHRAEAVLQKLLHTRSEWDFALKPMSDAGSLYLLNFIAQPVPPGDWEEQDMDFVIPVVCVTHDDLSSPHQLPPPRLFMRLCDRQLELVWKQPDWPWSSVQQHWKRVVWTALTQGHMPYPSTVRCDKGHAGKYTTTEEQVTDITHRTIHHGSEMQDGEDVRADADTCYKASIAASCTSLARLTISLTQLGSGKGPAARPTPLRGQDTSSASELSAPSCCPPAGSGLLVEVPPNAGQGAGQLARVAGWLCGDAVLPVSGVPGGASRAACSHSMDFQWVGSTLAPHLQVVVQCPPPHLPGRVAPQHQTSAHHGLLPSCSPLHPPHLDAEH